MRLRDILVVLDAGPASEGRLRLAAQIARQQGGSLKAVFLRSSSTSPYHARRTNQTLAVIGVPSTLVMPFLSEEAIPLDRGELLEQQFRDCVRGLDGEGEWHLLERPDAPILMDLGKVADLIVLGQVNPYAGAVPSWYRPEEIVVGCGRPVLMVPYVGSFEEIGRRVLIAWDGSREAVRALNDSLPLISSARIVTLMTIQPNFGAFESERTTMQNVLRHLARHDVFARTDETLQGRDAIHDVLLSRSVDLAVDMIVAGAYHRSPLREALNGGVSRGLFQHMTVPVLMSH